MSSHSESRTDNRQWIVAFAVVCLVHAHFLFNLGRWLWGRPHYQFFPAVLLAAAFLAYQRWHKIQLSDSFKLGVRTLTILGVSLLLFVVGSLFHSHWLGYLSWLAVTWAVIWHFTGTSGADQLRGPLFLLLLILPIPLNFDLKLIISLQQVASQAASWLLDLFQIRHNISGIAIITEQKSYMVEEACSGIHSLFSCLCAVVFFGVWNRYGIVRILAVTTIAVFWVVAANVLRVFMVVYSEARWGLPLDTGWRHELLGVVTYALALGMSLSTDRLVRFFVPVVTPDSVKASKNFHTANSTIEDLQNTSAKLKDNLERFLNKGRLSQRATALVLMALAILIYAPLTIADATRVVRQRLAQSQSTAPEVVKTGTYGEQLSVDDAMPKSVRDWQLTEVEKIDRSPDDPLGMTSTIFHYSNSDLTVTFSVDGYYDGWHDLAYCYTGLGWKIKSQSNIASDPQKAATALDMYKESGHQLVSYFSCFDSALAPVTPGERTIGTIRTFDNLLERLGAVAAPSQAIVPPVFQFQLTYVGEETLLDLEQQSLQTLFEELSGHAIAHLKEKRP